MKRIFFLLAAGILASTLCVGQVKIGSNPGSINSFSLLELESTDKGVLLPRIETAVALATMSGAPDGMIIYFVPDASIYIKKAGAWVKVNSNWLVNGTHINNENAGNVGIGAGLPTHGKLEVTGLVGNVTAMFGNATNSGISLNAGFPEVGFNYYFNGSNKAIAPGFAAVAGLNPLNGDFYIGNFNSNQAPAAYSDIPGYTDRLILKQNGNIGIGISPAEKLDVAGTIKLTGEVNSPSSGSANLLPLAYGKIRFDGTVLGGTGNFSVNKTGTGLYEITLTGESNVYTNQGSYMVQVTVESSATKLAAASFQVNNSIQVRTAQPRINYTNAFCNSCSDVYSYITNFSASQDEDNTFSILVFKL